MITEKGQFSIKMKAKGMTLGNVHIYSSFSGRGVGVSGHSVITLN